jgi:hypothetical protein
MENTVNTYGRPYTDGLYFQEIEKSLKRYQKELGVIVQTEKDNIRSDDTVFAVRRQRSYQSAQLSANERDRYIEDRIRVLTNILNNKIGVFG